MPPRADATKTRVPAVAAGFVNEHHKDHEGEGFTVVVDDGETVAMMRALWQLSESRQGWTSCCILLLGP